MESTSDTAPPPPKGHILHWLLGRLRSSRAARPILPSDEGRAPVEVTEAARLNRRDRDRHVARLRELRAIMGSRPAEADALDAAALDAAIASLLARPSLEDAAELEAWRALGRAWQGQALRYADPPQDPPALVEAHWPQDARLVGAALAFAVAQPGDA